MESKLYMVLLCVYVVGHGLCWWDFFESGIETILISNEANFVQHSVGCVISVLNG